MSKPWKAGPEVYATMQNLIANHFPMLAMVDDQILIVFKEKGAKTDDGITVIGGKTSKANPLLGTVGETDYKFVITLANDYWQDLTDEQREALLFHHLAACQVEEDPENGDPRCSVRLPMSFFREEVEQYGWWRTTGEVPASHIIEDLFGEKKTPEQIAAEKAEAKKAKAAARKAAMKAKQAKTPAP